MNSPKGLLIFAMAILTGTRGSAAEDTAPQTMKPSVTLTSSDSQVKECGYHRVTSEDEWIKVWQRHKGAKEAKDYDLYFNPLNLPFIDFKTCMVIAIFQGDGTNSAGLKAVEVLEDKTSIIFRFKDKFYQTFGGEGVGTKSVYGFFVLPRSTKTVILQEDVQHGIGKPPIWKERVRFPK